MEQLCDVPAIMAGMLVIVYLLLAVMIVVAVGGIGVGIYCAIRNGTFWQQVKETLGAFALMALMIGGIAAVAWVIGAILQAAACP